MFCAINTELYADHSVVHVVSDAVLEIVSTRKLLKQWRFELMKICPND